MPRHSAVQRLAIATIGLARPFSGRRGFPLYALIEHRGRRSGTLRRTPIVARRTATGFVIPVPFGTKTQWVQNVIAAGTATLRWKGSDWPVHHPQMVALSAAAPALSPVQRRIAARAGILEFLALDDGRD